MLRRIGRVARRLFTEGRLHERGKVERAIATSIARKKAVVVQIGAHEGTANDHLRSFILRNPQWRTILVEPVPYLFRGLAKNYKNTPGVELACLAIGEAAGKLPFYYVSEQAKSNADIPAWATQLGSFDRAHILKHSSALERYIVQEDVRSDRLMSFLSDFDAVHLDALFVDAEGFDFQILSQLDLSICRPGLIVYEHKHMLDEHQTELRGTLELAGYELQCTNEDTVAVRRPSL